MTQDIILNEERAKLIHKLEALKKESANLFYKRDEMLTYEYPKLCSLYLNEIGQLKYDEFSLQVDIKILSLRLSLIQAYINRNEMPDHDAIEKQVQAEMEKYRMTLENMMKDIREAKEYLSAPLLSPEEARELKALYVILVKRLHPDINPNLSERDEELYIKAVAAYKSRDLVTLRQIMLLVDSFRTDDLPEDTLLDQIDKVQKTIDAIKERISELESQFPFNLRDKIYDREWIEKEQSLLKESISALTEKKRSIEQTILVYKTWKPESLS